MIGKELKTRDSGAEDQCTIRTAQLNCGSLSVMKLIEVEYERNTRSYEKVSRGL